MSWRAIEITEVRLTPQEKAAMQNIQSSTEVGAEKLLGVVREFVSAIRSGGNQVANDDTIPDICRMHVVNRTRWLWLCEFPQLKNYQTPDRSKLNDSAEEFLTKVAEGKPPIEPPDNPVNAPAPGNAVEVATRPDPSRAASRKKMDGLV